MSRRERVLITAGPTREYLDPVRYLSNASSGQMGSCLAAAAIERDFDVTIVSGPVNVAYPAAAEVVPVVSTIEMRDAVVEHWPQCTGLIAAAAPADFRARQFSDSKIKKESGRCEMTLELIENPDILAEIGRLKSDSQWTIGFALETEPDFETCVQYAFEKLQRKNCDFIVLNDVSAIDSAENSVSIINVRGEVIARFSGTKAAVATGILNRVCLARDDP